MGDSLRNFDFSYRGNPQDEHPVGQRRQPMPKNKIVLIFHNHGQKASSTKMYVQFDDVYLPDCRPLIRLPAWKWSVWSVLR